MDLVKDDLDFVLTWRRPRSSYPTGYLPEVTSEPASPCVRVCTIAHERTPRPVAGRGVEREVHLSVTETISPTTPPASTPVTSTPVTEASLDTGWLSTQGGVICVRTRAKDPQDSTQYVFDDEPYGNFDLEALGIIADDKTERRAWDVVIKRQDDGKTLRRILDEKTLADSRKLTLWLTSAGVSVICPDGALGAGAPTGVRLLRYINAQKPPEATIVDQIGYHPDLNVFVAHEGILRPGETAFDATAPYRPSAQLATSGDAPFAYGFAPKGLDEVKDVLGQVLTFHDETPLAVAASWMVMSLVQSAIIQHSSHFPVMAVEAPSGSGKTTGALSMLRQLLTGNTSGPAQGTIPDVRQKLASTRSGFVHIDDLDEPKSVFEMLRLSTADGTKMMRSHASGFMASQHSQLTGTILLTGEHLGLRSQKALADRIVLLELTDPSDRKSQIPGREHLSQWLDVTALQRRYPGSTGMAALAGTVVAEVLRWLDDVEALIDETKPCAGRLGDKYAVILAGACFVDHLLGDPKAWTKKGLTYARVAAWVKEDMKFANSWDNALTTEVLPWALHEYGEWAGIGMAAFEPIKISGKSFVTAPAFYRQESGMFDAIFIHPRTLADAWHAYKGHKTEDRVHSASAFVAQAKIAGFEEKVIKINGKSLKGWQLTGEKVDILRERAS